MKLICPQCHYTGLVDATASAASSSDECSVCPRCGGPLSQLLWSDSQLSTLTTAAATTAAAPQRIMENQNAYAPSAETGVDDVLDIPSQPRSAQPTGEQMLVLEDVIPEPELSAADEIIEPQITSTDEEETLVSPRHGGHTALSEPAAWAVDMSPVAGPEGYGASQTSSFDYDGGRAWLRVAPLLLLLGALVFFALYYLGNRVGSWGSKTPESAASPAQQTETQSAAPTSAPVESPSTASQPADSGAVATKEETRTPPVEKPRAETARRESKPPVTVEPKPTEAVTAPTAPAPVAEQATGNFTVQVGSYNNPAQADERAGLLRSSGVEARVVRAEIPRRGTWYRVQAGRFSSQTEAARYAAELKSKGATDDFLITESQGQ